MQRFLSARPAPAIGNDVCVAFESNSTSEEKTLHDVNRLVFGNESFRNQQLDIIQATLRNEDIFVVMPTGGGKSLCYALPAVVSKGVTVVVSPLISLIEDQVSNFIQLPSGGIPAAYLTSNCTETMAKMVFEDLRRSRVGEEPYIKLLYVTPERIVKGGQSTRQALFELYQNEMLARFVIDEAHCVSAWGHDFRKDYAALGILKQDFPEVPIVALTATARQRVAEDTIKILAIPHCRRFHTGFDRPNLFFEVLEKPAKTLEGMETIVRYIHSKFPQSTGIVYCMTRSDCEDMAAFLQQNKITADFYHAGQSKADRKLVQHMWMQGEIKVVCATIAYGMGIDMPSVRFVIHASLSKSVEGYYQEAGRAGRDGQYSECVIFFNPRDVNRLLNIMSRPKLTKKDSDMLEEMSEYCINKQNCRRQIFSDKFTEQRDKNFSRCEMQCDNCKARNGIARRSFAKICVQAESTSSIPPLDLQTKWNVNQASDEPASAKGSAMAKATFVKASSLPLKPISSSKKLGGSMFTKPTLLSVHPKSALSKIGSSSSQPLIIDLVDGEDGDDKGGDDDDDEGEWLAPLRKRPRK